jgi:hypothetical protein
LYAEPASVEVAYTTEPVADAEIPCTPLIAAAIEAAVSAVVAFWFQSEPHLYLVPFIVMYAPNRLEVEVTVI